MNFISGQDGVLSIKQPLGNAVNSCSKDFKDLGYAEIKNFLELYGDAYMRLIKKELHFINPIVNCSIAPEAWIMISFETESQARDAKKLLWRSLHG
jgi:hypothetical protein